MQKNKEILRKNTRVIGSILRAQRERIGLTQADIARALNYKNNNFICMFENGRSPVPMGKLKQVINAYQQESNFSLALLKMIQPDIWTLFVDLFVSNRELVSLTAEEIEQVIESIINSKLDEFGLSK